MHRLRPKDRNMIMEKKKLLDIEMQKLTMAVEEQKEKRMYEDRDIMLMNPSRIDDITRRFCELTCGDIKAKALRASAGSGAESFGNSVWAFGYPNPLPKR
ncbi:3-deoxy-D-manno-octulosonic-acid transferase [Hordeum vulgare]|nr:3-deoxy-D-manno-octulosonic-acid transferase [Hordeum vulgare]